MSSLHEHTLDVIKGFYDASMDESLWTAALENLCGLTRSHGASFWVLDGSGKTLLPTFICINFDMTSIKEYLEYTASIDPTVQYLVAHPHEPIVHDSMVISETEKDKHPYYDWHERHIDCRFRIVGQVHLTPGVQAGVALHRRRKEGRYEPDDIERFRVLHGHLERALAIAFRVGTLGSVNKLTTEYLDRGTVAVIFLDERKRIVFANRMAETIQSSNDGIKFEASGVVLANHGDNEKLQSLIAQVVSPLGSAAISPGGAMRALRPSGKRPYGILVGPVSGGYPVLSAFHPAVCVVVTDPDNHTPLPGQLIQAAFGLTEAETSLATLLANGEELRTAAQRLSITYGTARTRLAQIFQKTETRRQGELIRLLLKTIA